MIQFVGVSEIIQLLGDEGFMPHGMCYMWNPTTLWANVIGDTVTSVSYFMIPGFLIYFVNKRRSIELRGVFLAFAAFIISCGAVHAISVVNVWSPFYNLSGVLKILMAVVSLATVVLMYLKMPLALKIPSPADLQVVNDELRVQIEAKNKLQHQLEEQTKQLQKTVQLLNDTQRAANIGSWRLDLEEKEVMWSEQTYRIYNIDKEADISLETAITLFKQEHWDDINQTIRTATEKKANWDKEWLLVDADKQKKWVRSIGYPVVEEGEVIAIEGLLMDIDAQKRASDELKERTEELEESNQELESFSYSISHDLRAPLRSINGYSQILKEDYDDKLDDEGIRLLDVICESARKMGELIDDILAFSRLGRKDLVKKKLDIHMLVRSISEEVKNSFEASNNVIIEISDLPPAYGDISLIHQVFQNLVENAIKYSSVREEIRLEIGATEMNGDTVYFVKDNGVGFNMDYHDKIFGVFQRLHTDSEFKGTGVGLAIVKRIIQKHNGDIWAESVQGKGSTFYFKLGE